MRKRLLLLWSPVVLGLALLLPATAMANGRYSYTILQNSPRHNRADPTRSARDVAHCLGEIGWRAKYRVGHPHTDQRLRNEFGAFSACFARAMSVN